MPVGGERFSDSDRASEVLGGASVGIDEKVVADGTCTAAGRVGVEIRGFGWAGDEIVGVGVVVGVVAAGRFEVGIWVTGFG